MEAVFKTCREEMSQGRDWGLLARGLESKGLNEEKLELTTILETEEQFDLL